MDEATVQLLENTANMLRGMTMDPAIPAHRDDLRAVIDSQEIEIARLRAELARAANSDPCEPLPPLPGIDGKPKTPTLT